MTDSAHWNGQNTVAGCRLERKVYQKRDITSSERRHKISLSYYLPCSDSLFQHHKTPSAEISLTIPLSIWHISGRQLAEKLSNAADFVAHSHIMEKITCSAHRGISTGQCCPILSNHIFLIFMRKTIQDITTQSQQQSSLAEISLPRCLFMSTSLHQT